MSKSLYVGINSTARKVKALYVGINGTARKVRKAYLGVNGVARLVWSTNLIEETPFGAGAGVNSCAYVNGYIVLFESGWSRGDAGRIAYSTDGLNWSYCNMAAPTAGVTSAAGTTASGRVHWTDMIYNGQYICLGTDANGMAVISRSSSLSGSWSSACPQTAYDGYWRHFTVNYTNWEEPARLPSNGKYLAPRDTNVVSGKPIYHDYNDTDWSKSYGFSISAYDPTYPPVIYEGKSDTFLLQRVSPPDYWSNDDDICFGNIKSENSRRYDTMSISSSKRAWDICEGSDDYILFVIRDSNEIAVYKGLSQGAGYDSLNITPVSNFSGSRFSCIRSYNGTAVAVSFNGAEMNLYSSTAPYTSWSRHIVSLPYSVQTYMKFELTANGFVLTYRDTSSIYRAFVYRN